MNIYWFRENSVHDASQLHLAGKNCSVPIYQVPENFSLVSEIIRILKLFLQIQLFIMSQQAFRKKAANAVSMTFGIYCCWSVHKKNRMCIFVLEVFVGVDEEKKKKRKKEVIKKKAHKNISWFSKANTWKENCHLIWVYSWVRNNHKLTKRCVYCWDLYLFAYHSSRLESQWTRPPPGLLPQTSRTVFLHSHAVAPHLGQRIIIPIKAHHILHLSLHFTLYILKSRIFHFNPAIVCVSLYGWSLAFAACFFSFIFHEERTWTVNLLEQWSKFMAY